MKQLSKSELLIQTKAAVKREKDALIQVLSFFREIEGRKLHLEMGYKSMHEFAVQELHYSDGAAYRRVQSMRLLSEIPEAEGLLVSGALNLETIAALQTHARTARLSTEKKRELLRKLEGKSRREAEKLLTGDHRIEIKVSPELLEKLRKLQIQMAATDVAKVIEILADQAMRKEAKPALAAKPSAARFATKAQKREVLQRDGARCSFQGTRKNCSATEHLQMDHRQPHALGGPTSSANFRVLCANHNRYAAERLGLSYSPPPPRAG